MILPAGGYCRYTAECVLCGTVFTCIPWVARTPAGSCPGALSHTAAPALDRLEARSAAAHTSSLASPAPA